MTKSPHQLIVGDCLQVMYGMPTDHVDLVVCRDRKSVV